MLNINTFKSFNEERSEFKLRTVSPPSDKSPLGSEPKSPFSKIRVGNNSFIIVRSSSPSGEYEIKFSDSKLEILSTGIVDVNDALKLERELGEALKHFEDLDLDSHILFEIVRKYSETFYLNN